MVEQFKKYKPRPKIQAAINWGAISTVGVGIFAVAFPELYERFPPAFEAAIVASVTSFAGYMKVEN